MKTKFDEWLADMDAKTDWDEITPTDMMVMAWNAGAKAAAAECEIRILGLICDGPEPEEIKP